MKTCSKCKVEQPKTNFNKDKNRKDGLTCHCKSCVSFYCKTRNGVVDRDKINSLSREWKRSNPEKVRANWIKQIYSLEWSNYLQLYEHQGGNCKLCNSPLKLHKGIDKNCDVAVVDHCHTTGQVRGLLCDTCNKGLGHFKDNIKTLQNAIEYLENSVMTKDQYLAEIKKMRG